jgi:signal transduction histidine kinase
MVLSSVAAVAFAGWTAIRLPESIGPLGGSSELVVGGGGLVWVTTGAVLVSLRPRNVLGWFHIAAGAAMAGGAALWAYESSALVLVQDHLGGWTSVVFDPAAAEVEQIRFLLDRLEGATVWPLLLAFYPDGRLPSRAWWWPVGGIVAALVFDVLHAVTGLDGWVGLALYLPSALAICVGSIVRLVQARPPQRQQLAWLVCVVMPVAAFASYSSTEYWFPLDNYPGFLAPIAVAAGVLRYRLLGIEWVLRRWLVYGMLTVLVFGVYLAASAAAGTVLGRRPLPGVLAAAVIAVGLVPVRDRLQRAADRIIFGERRDPLRALIRLGQRVAATPEKELLPAALTSVAAAVRAPAVAVTTADNQIVTQIGGQPGRARAETALPLEFGGERIGTLTVAIPSAEETYTDSQLQLLAALAPQIAVLLRAVQLTEALQAERDRVVAASATERDRLRRDLHDGLGPSLTGVGLGLQALSDALPHTDPAAQTLTERIRAEVATAVAEVRRIIDDLSPAALDTMDLVAAIRRHTQTVSTVLAVEVDAADLPALSPQVESAAFRITTEALTNAARHAHARHAHIILTASDRSLRITVADDGHGIGAANTGVGLASMRRRAETLGGSLRIETTATGTSITATLPLEQP